MSLLRLRRLTTLPEASSLEFPTSENSRFDLRAIAANMRKQIITRKLHPPPPLEREWLDLETLASVEVTSEAEAFPIESALLPEKKRGWRAAEPGRQTAHPHWPRLLAVGMLQSFRKGRSAMLTGPFG